MELMKPFLGLLPIISPSFRSRWWYPDTHAATDPQSPAFQNVFQSQDILPSDPATVANAKQVGNMHDLRFLKAWNQSAKESPHAHDRFFSFNIGSADLLPITWINSQGNFRTIKKDSICKTGNTKKLN